ncbi:hypothetical protein [Aquibacillus saliphilus]|uniref:hypothetical protein n=1 Tax=Aquibacillus saliphilus TaxID=1909422 RepID=UPI001CEFEAEF|nr:hypothetical protein [Aquibacillus saliphilus]
MCLASEYLNTIIKAQKDFDNRKHELNLLRSKYDKEINNLYHDLETRKFNACEGYYITKKLQKILQKRRLVKTEFNNMSCVFKSMNMDIIKKQLNNGDKYLRKMIENGEETDYTKDFDFDIHDIFESEREKVEV